MPDLPKTTVKIITALLKHQAKLWLGEETVGIAAETFIDKDLQQRLDDWVDSDKSAKEIQRAVEQTQIYLQDPKNCPDKDIRHIFRDLTFGDLPSVQTALTELPDALDSGKLLETLEAAFVRDLPNLSPAQQKEGARLYTYALLSAVGSLERFTLPIIRQAVLDNSKKLDALGMGQAEIKSLLEKLSSLHPPSPTASTASARTLPGDLPPGSYLPFPRNNIFTGRVADLEKLYESLVLPSPLGEGPGVRSVVVNQAVTGMGGLGKTQLAVEFAYRCGHRFRGVHWLDMREAQTLDSQIALCGSKMDLLDYPPTQPEQVTAVAREWRRDGPRLLILDNFEEVESANEVIGALSHSNLRLLITSRRADWTPALGLNRLALDEFSPGESLAFLRNYVPAERESDEELERLAKHLGYLPLALELAGRYLEKQPRLKVTDYLAQLEKALEHKSMQNWKAEQKSLTGHDLSLLQTFARSWDEVKNPTSQKLFIALGYCAPNTPIPYEIMEAALGDEKGACDECLNELAGLGLLKAGRSIHPLLAEFARKLDEGQADLLKPFSEALAELASQTNREADQKGNYSLFTPLLSHIRAVAEHAEQASLDSSGTLWNEIGYHISDLADYNGAKAAYERALKIFEKFFPPDHPNIKSVRGNLERL